MKTIISAKNEMAEKAAEHIKRILKEKPNAVLALTAGRSTSELYLRLKSQCIRGELSLQNARIFAVTELIGSERGISHREELKSELTDGTDASEENIFFLQEDNYKSYDEKIKSCGGIDIAVLGIGMNGHFGYNEPGTQFDTYTHIQKLTQSTKRELAGEYGKVEKVLTMGVKTICSAREIIVLAAGEEKADIVFKAVYGRTDSIVPAAFLQIPQQVTMYLDTCAAHKL